MAVHFPRHTQRLAKPCATIRLMTSDDTGLPTKEEALEAVRRAGAKERRAHEAAQRALAELGDAVAMAYRLRIPPSEFLDAVRFTRESVRRMAADRGVEPLRPATVVSRRKAAE